MPRFMVYDKAEAKGCANWEDWDYGEDWYDWESYLVDTTTDEIIYKDGGEPEDQTLGRDLSFFVDWMNRLANG